MTMTESGQAVEKVIAFNPADFALKLDTIRRNHALEHATLHLMSASGRQKKRVAGYSDLSGFWLIGPVDTAEVETQAAQALQRLKAGEKRLAIHPQCGTNFGVTALLGTFAVLLSLVGVKKEKGAILERMPLVYLLLTMTTFFGPILGKKVQEAVTTNADPADLSLGEVKRFERNGMILHHVSTHSDRVEGGLCRLIWER